MSDYKALAEHIAELADKEYWGEADIQYVLTELKRVAKELGIKLDLELLRELLPTLGKHMTNIRHEAWQSSSSNC